MGTYRAASEPLRRSWYVLGVAWRPGFAKEVRVFGLGGWLLAHSELQPRPWTLLAQVTRLNLRVAAAALLVLAAYGLAPAPSAWDAYHHTVALARSPRCSR